MLLQPACRILVANLLTRHHLFLEPLHCLRPGATRSTLAWRRDGQIVPSAVGLDGVSRVMTFESVVREDAGVYTCTGTSPGGTDTKDTTLDVRQILQTCEGFRSSAGSGWTMPGHNLGRTASLDSAAGPAVSPYVLPDLSGSLVGGTLKHEVVASDSALFSSVVEGDGITRVRAYSSSTLAPLWTTNFTNLEQPVLMDDTVYGVSPDGCIAALAAIDGGVLWDFCTVDELDVDNGPIGGCPILCLSDDALGNSPCPAGTLAPHHLFTTALASLTWACRAGSPPLVWANSSGHVHVAITSRTGVVTTVTPVAGSASVVWSYTAGAGCAVPKTTEGFLAVAEEESVLVYSCTSSIHAISTLTGQRAWSHASAGTSYLAAASGLVVYQDGVDLLARRISGGREAWRYDTLLSEQLTAFAAHESVDVVSVATADGFLHAVQLSDGAKLWQRSRVGANGKQYLSMTAAGTLLVADHTGYIEAYESRFGE